MRIVHTVRFIHTRGEFAGRQQSPTSSRCHPGSRDPNPSGTAERRDRTQHHRQSLQTRGLPAPAPGCLLHGATGFHRPMPSRGRLAAPSGTESSNGRMAVGDAGRTRSNRGDGSDRREPRDAGLATPLSARHPGGMDRRGTGSADHPPGAHGSRLRERAYAERGRLAHRRKHRTASPPAGCVAALRRRTARVRGVAEPTAGGGRQRGVRARTHLRPRVEAAGVEPVGEPPGGAVRG